MKLSILTTILALSVSALAAVQPQKSVIVSYEASTPDSFIESAKEAIVSAGGKITHTYSLIKGFAAIAPAKILDTVSVQGTKYEVNIEDDLEVGINKQH